MTNMEPMRIGRLARRTGVSVKALRFYDSQGLLFRAGRTAANYRLFPDEAITCVETIRTLKAAGFTTRDVRELAAAHRSGGNPEVVVRRKLAQVLERLMREHDELQTRIARLTDLLRDVRALRCAQPARPRSRPADSSSLTAPVQTKIN
jgi:MerR family transcriptional regulator, copper efflux regulator